MNDHMNNCCPLCGWNEPQPFFEDKNRVYLSCTKCALVFVPCEYHLDKTAEKAEYDLHNNDPMDPGYCRFLSRLSQPMLERLGPGLNGLDFGCGPGPALNMLMKDGGHNMDLYDPFYFNNTDLFSKTYDFITTTEVVEHLHDPGKEFNRLFDLLIKGGWLGIMTKLVIDKKAFSTWHYIRDLTHVCFYSQATFGFIAERYDASLTFIGQDVILLHKK